MSSGRSVDHFLGKSWLEMTDRGLAQLCTHQRGCRQHEPCEQAFDLFLQKLMKALSELPNADSCSIPNV